MGAALVSLAWHGVPERARCEWAPAQLTLIGLLVSAGAV